MADKELTIRLKLDRSQADQSSKSFHQAEAQRINGLLSEEQAAERKRQQTLADTGRVRTRVARDATDAERTARQATEQHIDSAKGLGNAYQGVGAAIGGMAIASTVMGAVRSAIDETAEHVKRLTEDFIRQRDALRELAGVMGMPGTRQFTMQQYGFAKDVGMSVEESTKFREAFQGEAQQYKSKFKSQAEFEAYEKASARFASQNNIDPATAARLAGGVVRAMPKGQTSQDAMTTLGGAFGTMQAGSGSNQVLAAQLSRTIGSMVGPGNAFASVEEAAVATRVQAEADAEEAFTMNQAIRRGILQMKPEEQAAMGINAKTPFFQAIKAIGEKSKEAQKAGLTQDEFLMQAGFSDERTRRGLNVAINQGVENKVIDTGFKDVGKVKPGATEASAAAFFADPEQAGMLRQAEAQRREEDAKLAQAKTLIAPFVEHARAKMSSTRADPSARFFFGMADVIAWPLRKMMGQEQGAMAQEEMELATAEIQNRAMQAGVNFQPITPSQAGGMSTRTLEARLARLVELTEEANRQRVQGGPVPPALPAGAGPAPNFQARP